MQHLRRAVSPGTLLAEDMSTKLASDRLVGGISAYNAVLRRFVDSLAEVMVKEFPSVGKSLCAFMAVALCFWDVAVSHYSCDNGQCKSGVMLAVFHVVGWVG